jgi:hypothetical protein
MWAIVWPLNPIMFPTAADLSPVTQRSNVHPAARSARPFGYLPQIFDLADGGVFDAG